MEEEKKKRHLDLPVFMCVHISSIKVAQGKFGRFFPRIQGKQILCNWKHSKWIAFLEGISIPNA